jgi:hypothetical protein
MSQNPLQRFFRQPAIYFRLPSRGQGYVPGSLDLPSNGEVPVYPMTAIDEITYRTPDALFNGEAVVSVIQSCVPNILDGWAVPSTDFDALLVAIRIASYGHNIDIDTKCPKCEHEHEFGLDLRSVIDKLHGSDYTQPLEMGDMVICFRPLSYKEMTANSQTQFEQQKTLQMINNGEITENEKLSNLNSMMKKLIEVTMEAIANSISEIRTQDAIVTEHGHILEFLNNVDRKLFEKIKDYVVSLRESSELQPLKITCTNCQTQYEQIFTLDMARFFEPAS